MAAPALGAGPGAGSPFLELGGYPAVLPSPTDGWGALAAAVGSLRPFQVRLLDTFSVSVARELSDDSLRLNQRLLSDPAACTTLREVGLLVEQPSPAGAAPDAAPDVAPDVAPGEDWGADRWSIGRLCAHLVRHEIELDDLAPRLAAGVR